MKENETKGNQVRVEFDNFVREMHKNKKLEQQQWEWYNKETSNLQQI